MKVDLTAEIGIGGDQCGEVGRIEVGRIPGEACSVADVAGMLRRIEGEFISRKRGGGTLKREVVEQIAIVGAASTAEDHVLLVRVEVVGEADTRLPRILERVAVMAVADVVVDVVIGVLDVLPTVQRIDESRWGPVIEIGGRFLVVPA